MEAPSRLTVDMRPGEHLLLDGRIVVELLEKSGKLARLKIVAPREVKILREECDQPRAMREKIIA